MRGVVQLPCPASDDACCGEVISLLACRGAADSSAAFGFGMTRTLEGGLRRGRLTLAAAAWQEQRKNRAAASGTSRGAHLDRAVVFADDSFRKPEPEPSSRVPLSCVERLEKVGA